MLLPQLDDFSALFQNDTPLIDTRAPIEFTQGAFPFTTNLPLMSDEERKTIGTCYKNHGQEAAIKLGHQLVNGQTKQARIHAWETFIQENPNGALYCFRGGLRSQISQQWIYETTGIAYPRIKGGYKALRRFLIDETERLVHHIKPIVLAGQTGCGKTILLKQIENHIDLEGLANHRGSAFGNTTTPQPTQIAFENALGIDLIKKQQHGTILFEDEGHSIGQIRIPSSLYQVNQQADIILLEASLAQRINITIQEYISNMHTEFVNQHGDEIGFEKFTEYFMGSLNKIQKRLGGERHNQLVAQTKEAFIIHQKTADVSPYQAIIKTLLVDYYDPMYQYQIEKKRDRIVFTGTHDAVLDYLAQKQ